MTPRSGVRGTGLLASVLLAVLLAACNGCNSQPVKLYEAGPPSDAPLDSPSQGDGAPTDGPVAPSCPQGFMFGAAMTTPGIAAADKMFGAVTPDELTIAWVTPTAGVAWADRADASQPFGAAQTVAGTFEHDRVALSSDALKLIVVMQGAKTFGQVTRAKRTDPFGSTPDTQPFAMLLTAFGMEGDAGMAMGNIGDPVLAASGTQMFFSVFNQGNRNTVAVTQFTGVAWGKPVMVTQTELASSGTQRRRPTGLSSDARTLFFWDEVDSKEKAGWRKTSQTVDLTFSGFVDLGDKKDAQPTASCTRLYFTNPPGSPSDVKLADKQ